MGIARNIRGRAGAGLGVMIGVLLVATGCTAGDPGAKPGPGSDAESGIELIPEQVRDEYMGVADFYDIATNPYEDWTPPAPPWKLCYNDSYAGNSWRQAGLAQAEALNQQLIDAGLSKGELNVTNADNDINTQVSQLNNQVSQGCQVIFTQPASSTGLCSAIDNAFKQNVLVITIVGPADCKNVINTSLNDYKVGYESAKWLGSTVKKGNVLLVTGIPGATANEARVAGVKDALKEQSGVSIIGEVAGSWTPSTAKTEVLKFLSTHPQEIKGVWQAGLMMPATGDAFLQLGRDLPPITGLVGECSELAYWKKNGMSSTGYNQGGAPAIYEAFYVANRMLAGGKPVSNLLLYPLPTIDDDNLNDWWTSDMTVNSTCDSTPPNNKAVDDSYWDQLFVGGDKPALVLKP